MKKAAILAPGLVAIVAACTPTVRVQAPTEPITINLNVKVEQEIRVKLEREVEDLIASNPDIF
ncbi:YnbE family lipoprotein [Henriciella barbarensis]|nr:YnbE family lipoprotein [Henriciella barbarensis]